MQPTFLEDFWTPERGTKLFPKTDITPGWWLKEPACSKECKSNSKFQNKNCDPECNTIRCEWDGGDCDAVPPRTQIKCIVFR